MTLGFFKRLITPDDEEALVDGCRELVLGNENKALEHLEKAVHLADGAYLVGFLALKQQRLEEAATYQATAADLPAAAHWLAAQAGKHSRLGHYFSKLRHLRHHEPHHHRRSIRVCGPGSSGRPIGLVEVYQRQERWEDAIACLARLQRLEPDNVVVKLSLAELLLDARPGVKNVCRKVVQLTRRHRERDAGPHRAALVQGQGPARALAPGRGAGDPDGRPTPIEEQY